MMHPISSVARMANLSTDRIRSWERRYKIVEPVRDKSGARLYSDKDVGRLALAREATRLGHPIRHVSRLSDEEVEELIGHARVFAEANADVVARLLAAMHANDLATASQILRTAVLLKPAHELVLDVLAPALREVGRRWKNGELAIWQEHFLSNQMLDVTASLRQAVRGALVIFATPTFELHSFGTALAALLAQARGVATCNLGVAVPSAEVIAAARALRAKAVVIGMTRETPDQTEATSYARELVGGLPPSVDLVLGGVTGAQVAVSLRLRRVRAAPTLELFDRLCCQWC